MSQPRVPVYEVAFPVLTYLSGTSDLGLFFNNSLGFSLVDYCDSNWASCSSSRYVSGYVLLLGGCPISWKSKKHATIAFSSAEAEYRALRELVAKIVWCSSRCFPLQAWSGVPFQLAWDVDT
ncbi:uncharacterized mitochondrial protein AtMg00810-like [Lycium barbarum]|uniref:uncharacterized mitochondrial protein AtMg00810-like n=1 Tax=Lycium barbarum TaxID=112863 RepID=UPI00293E12A0|nr:uncharacterized mitochondrial protein AtMg00810-like [Lycium barbarum]